MNAMNQSSRTFDVILVGTHPSLVWAATAFTAAQFRVLWIHDGEWDESIEAPNGQFVPLRAQTWPLFDILFRPWLHQIPHAHLGPRNPGGLWLDRPGGNLYLARDFSGLPSEWSRQASWWEHEPESSVSAFLDCIAGTDGQRNSAWVRALTQLWGQKPKNAASWDPKTLDTFPGHLEAALQTDGHPSHGSPPGTKFWRLWGNLDFRSLPEGNAGAMRPILQSLESLGVRFLQLDPSQKTDLRAIVRQGALRALDLLGETLHGRRFLIDERWAARMGLLANPADPTATMVTLAVTARRGAMLHALHESDRILFWQDDHAPVLEWDRTCFGDHELWRLRSLLPVSDPEDMRAQVFDRAHRMEQWMEERFPFCDYYISRMDPDFQRRDVRSTIVVPDALHRFQHSDRLTKLENLSWIDARTQTHWGELSPWISTVCALVRALQERSLPVTQVWQSWMHAYSEEK